MKKIKQLLEVEERFKSYDGKDKVITSHEMKQKIDSQPENPVNFKSGYPTMDKYIERFEGGEMIVVSGQTKHGKTTWAQSLTDNLASQDIYSLWFSYEMPPKQLLRKFPPETLFFLPQMLYDKDLLWIENKIFEAKLKYKVQAVFIDHLHFIIDLEARNSSWEVGRVVRHIKKLAVKHNVVIFLLAHLRKTKLEDKPPEIEDLRDSSFIAQDSDGVFFITRKYNLNSMTQEKEYFNTSMLTIAVHRETGTMGKNINLIYKNNKLYEENQESQTKIQFSN